jgi:hypothetical protein
MAICSDMKAEVIENTSRSKFSTKWTIQKRLFDETPTEIATHFDL